MRTGVILVGAVLWGCNVDTLGTRTGEGTLGASTKASEVPESEPKPDPIDALAAPLETRRSTNGNCLVTYAPMSVNASSPWSVPQMNPFVALGVTQDQVLAASLPMQFRTALSDGETVVKVSLVLERGSTGGDVYDGLERHGPGVRVAVGTDHVESATRKGGDSHWPKESTGTRRYELANLNASASDHIDVLTWLQCRIDERTQAKVSSAKLEVEISGRTNCE